MLSVKGFGVIHELVSNEPGIVSPIGELSSQGRSFSTEVAHHAYPDLDTVRLSIFSCRNELGNRVPNDSSVGREMTEVLYWVAERITSRQVGINKGIFIDALRNRFSSLATHWDCGKIITANGYDAPEWISWSGDGNTNSDDDLEAKIWLVNRAFEFQFPHTEFIFVSPIDVLNDFHKDHTSVLPIISGLTPTHIISKLDVARNEVPPTKLTADMYLWHDKHNPGVTAPTYWPIAIYGLAGTDPDTLRTHLAAWILENSEYGEYEWNKVFPDIFTPTEFQIIPNWTSVALAAPTAEGIIYNPATSTKEARQLASIFMSDFPAEHIDDNLEIVPSVYQSLSFSVCGGLGNRDDIFKLSKMLPDLMLVGTMSPDFARMSPRTQAVIISLHTMFHFAAKYQDGDELPSDISVLKRNDGVFLAIKVYGVNYNILTKSSLLAYLNK